MGITSAVIRKPEWAEWRTRDGAGSRFGADRDETYKLTLGEEAWHRLAPEVRERFSFKPDRDETVCYAGTMQTVTLSFMGWLFAQTCRLIGTPLSPYRGENVPMRIVLSRDGTNGVRWRRTYRFEKAGEFTVCSTKCKGRDGEVIEHIGCGFQMRLRLSEESGALVFTSTAYECALFGRTFSIPTLLTPGRTTVRHEQLIGDRFRFSLSVIHPMLGETIFQDGVFYSVSDR